MSFRAGPTVSGVSPVVVDLCCPFEKFCLPQRQIRPQTVWTSRLVRFTKAAIKLPFVTKWNSQLPYRSAFQISLLLYLLVSTNCRPSLLEWTIACKNVHRFGSQRRSRLQGREEE